MNITERVILEQFPYWQGALDAAIPELAADSFVFVGCGTSYNLALTLAAVFNGRGRRAIAVPGGEWAERRSAYLADTTGATVVAISRSGESTEAVRAVRVSRATGVPTVAITCEKDSSIAREAETVIHAPTHPDEGIVMSVSASLMLVLGLRLAGERVDPAVAAAAGAALAAIGAQAPAVIAGRNKYVFLGGGAYFGLAAEGALKAQEMSLSVSQPFHTMEYRHGPISLADEDMVAVMLYSEDTPAGEAKLASELQAKGVRVIGLGGPGDLSVGLDISGLQRMLAMLPALQILGERVAGAKGIDSTAPRHLTKVVTLA